MSLYHYLLLYLIPSKFFWFNIFVDTGQGWWHSGESDKYNRCELGIEYCPVRHNLGIQLDTTGDIKAWDRGRSEKPKKEVVDDKEWQKERNRR